MSRLVALYSSLTDQEFTNLRKGPVKTQGVVTLNSKDESVLLNLVCAEKLEDLNRVAGTISRLGKKCSSLELNGFGSNFEEMKKGNLNGSVNSGDADLFKSKNVEKIIRTMEKYVNKTLLLHGALTALTELESSEKKVQGWRKTGSLAKIQKMNLDYFNERINFQRKQVRHYREISLWNQTFDKCVEMMAKIAGIVYARICVVFCPFVPTLPCNTKKTAVDRRSSLFHISAPKSAQMRVHPEADHCLIEDKRKYIHRPSKSGPIPSIFRKPAVGLTRFYSGELRRREKGSGFRIAAAPVSRTGNSENSEKMGINNKSTDTNYRAILQSPPENTVGSAGLALRYANVIVNAERYFNFPDTINKEARAQMYELLPANLKQRIREKLKSYWEDVLEGAEGRGVVLGWKMEVEEIINWLSPVAHDTVRWQQERNLEKQRFDAKPTVLLMQTLHFSDQEKTEAAMVDVLVGLSCIFRYENWGFDERTSFKF